MQAAAYMPVHNYSKWLCRVLDPSVLFYNVRTKGSNPFTPLQGKLVSDDLPIRHTDEQLVGQIDSVENGEVTGWACLRAATLIKPLQVCVIFGPVYLCWCSD